MGNSKDLPVENDKSRKEISFDIEKLWWASEEKALFFESKEVKKLRKKQYELSCRIRERAQEILKGSQREIFLLVHYTHKSITDACKILNLKYSVGYQRLRRARRKLKHYFERVEIETKGE